MSIFGEIHRMASEKRAARNVARKAALSSNRMGGQHEQGVAEKAPGASIRQQDRTGQSVRVGKILIGSKKGKLGNPVELIRAGLPLESIDRVRALLAFTDQQPILDLIGMSKRTYQRRLKVGKGLDAVESDRLYRVAKIEARAAAVFDDDAVAVDWLRTKNRALGEEPINLLDTEAGTDMVERALTRIEHGVFA